MVFSLSSIDESVPLKSNRCEISRGSGRPRCGPPACRARRRRRSWAWRAVPPWRSDVRTACYCTPGSVPERPKGTGCKPVAQATGVRIPPGPPLAGGPASAHACTRRGALRPPESIVRDVVSRHLHDLGHPWPLRRCWRTRDRRRCRPRPAASVGPSDHALHDHDVEPLPELATDLALGADDLEAAPPVQGDRRVVAADDAGDHRVVPVLLGEPDELGRGAAGRRRRRGGRRGRRPSPRPS